MNARERSLTEIYAPEFKKMLLEQLRKKILCRVISGGQTGVDLAGLQAADHVGIRTGGTAPKGYKTEIGFRPGLLKSYGLREHTDPGYEARTLENVMNSDMTLLIGNMTGGTKLTAEMCLRLKRKRHFISRDSLLQLDEIDKAYDRVVSARRSMGRAIVLNIAGSRESKIPGVQDTAEIFLIRLFQKIKDAEA